MVRSLRVLAALVVVALAAVPARAADWMSGPVVAPGHAVGPVAPPGEGRPRGSCCRRLWAWVTYHPIASSCECSRQGCRCCCRPRLYEYFLDLHPGCDHGGCDHCGVPPVPGPVEVGPPAAPAIGPPTTEDTGPAPTEAAPVTGRVAPPQFPTGPVGGAAAPTETVNGNWHSGEEEMPAAPNPGVLQTGGNR